MPILYAQTASLNVFVNTGDFTVYNSLSILTSSFALQKSFAHGAFSRITDTAINTTSPITGWGNRNSAYGHHAEGYRHIIRIFAGNTFTYIPLNLVRANHAEGYANDVEFRACHAEGRNNICTYAQFAHAEGISNTAYGSGGSRNAQHIEGSGSNISNAQYAHAEGGAHIIAGGNFVATTQGIGLHVEGFRHRQFSGAGFSYCHLEGAFNGLGVGNNGNSNSHIEGTNNSGSGQRNNHVEGHRNTQWSANFRGYHQEGERNHITNAALGNGTVHMEGYGNIISPGTYNFLNIHTQGYQTLVTYQQCSTEGYQTTASAGIATGKGTYTPSGFRTGYTDYITGHYNTSSYYVSRPSTPATSSITYFSIGGGISHSKRADIFIAYAQQGTQGNPTGYRQLLLPGVLNSGPYADDTAAAAGGVPIGGLYRLADGIENNILQIRVS